MLRLLLALGLGVTASTTTAQSFEITCHYTIEDTRFQGSRHLTRSLSFINGIKDYVPCDFTDKTITCSVKDSKAFYREEIDRLSGKTVIKYGKNDLESGKPAYVASWQGQCEPVPIGMPNQLAAPSDQAPSTE